MGARADEHDPVVDPGADDIPVQRRRERLLADLDTSTGRGLEIGPLFSPLVLKSDADVQYVDVHSAEGLRDYYRDHPGVDLDRIVEVDHVLYADGELRSVRDTTHDTGRVDWVVASHVVEHVPNVIGWFADLAETLVDGGRLALVVPDRRYTFDATRVPTTVGEMLQAHEQRDQRPSLRAVYDYFSTAIELTAHDAWRGADPAAQPRTFGPGDVQAAVQRHRATSDYIDCHAWVWTPQEFVRQLAELSALGVLDFVVEGVRSTPPSDLEFYVVLRRLPREATQDERLTQLAEGFTGPSDAVLDEVGPQLPDPVTTPELHSPFEVSRLERALLVRKRAVMGSLRRMVGRGRGG